MAVRDPAFWRRFSVAVHQEEEAAQAQRPDLKHTYVLSSTPTSPDTLSPAKPQPLHLGQRRNRSLLDLTGRPQSRFTFWTTVDTGHRESWLERQQQKKSRRTCMCWVFWLCLIAIVTGVVIAILYLKSRGII